MSSRKIKPRVLDLMSGPDLAFALKELRPLPAKDVVNALFSVICRGEPLMRWRSISCMGAAVARLADEDLEEARIIMRRLLWSLNDESGGIGWGAPESMAEIMCAHAGLAAEYVHMLLSYLRKDGEELCQEGNCIEHLPLQRGVVWGIARLSRCNRKLLLDKGAAADIPPYLAAPDAEIRGLAALTAGALKLSATRPVLLRLSSDPAPLSLYREGNFVETTVGTLARSALETITT